MKCQIEYIHINLLTGFELGLPIDLKKKEKNEEWV